MNETNNWSLQQNGKGLYILTLSSNEGTEKMWVSDDELFNLKLLLNSLEIPFPANELPL